MACLIDRDNDGRFDAGEVSLLTDERGRWRFNNRPAGAYTVAVVQKSGWVAPPRGRGRTT